MLHLCAFSISLFLVSCGIANNISLKYSSIFSYKIFFESGEFYLKNEIIYLFFNFTILVNYTLLFLFCN